MNKTLVIRELREVAEVPNGFDRNVLLLIQENIACDVVKLYHNDLVRLMHDQRTHNVSSLDAEKERKAFFAEKLQMEYRTRAANGGGFSLPLYMETAENHYSMEIRRLLQQVQDFIAHGRYVAELHFAGSVREMRVVDPGMDDLSKKVAAGLNSINDALEKLSRIRVQTASRVSQELKQGLNDGLAKIQGDSFAISMLNEAHTLADAQRELAKFEHDDNNTLSPR